MRKKMADASSLIDTTREFITKEVNTRNFQGDICLVSFKDVRKPWHVNDFEKEQTILDCNYKWLEIYPKDSEYACTAMLDDKNKIIQWYFDTAKSIGKEDKIPYIEDLYLDLVIKDNGDFLLLDEDELYQALQEKDITLQDYKKAYNTVENLIDKYAKSNVEKLYKETKQYLELFNL